MTRKSESGQILLFTMFALIVVLFTVLFIIGGAQVYYQSSFRSISSEKTTALAEAGIDKAVASLNKPGSNYNGENETMLGDGSFSVSITDTGSGKKLIQSTGYIPNKTSPKNKKVIQVSVSTGAGISFVYGVLIGEGGISMGNGSTINGSIYANGSITGGGNNLITGDAYVAAGVQPNANQQNDCTGTNCQDYIFGKNSSGQNRLDVAQSFVPSISAALNKISLKLKKVGTPSNLTVRVMTDNSGIPNKNNVLASGTLAANLVGTAFGFVDVTFGSTPMLDADTTYWVMLAAQGLDNNNYWVWSEDIAQSYTPGSSKWSADWQVITPVWTAISGDMAFKIWMGGGPVNSIAMGNGSIVRGNVYANTIDGLTVNKDAYYQTITDSIVYGSSCPNIHCHPNSSDPPPMAMPISDSNISEWKDDALKYGVTTGNITGCPAKIGPGKIDGNVTTSSNCTIIVVTPIWITKDLTFGNSAILKMDPSLGSSSGVIIVDGLTVFANSDNLLGTGVAGSYLTLLSTYNSQISGNVAINTGNSSITGILYAPFGEISLANNANFKEAVAWKISMGNSAILTYDSGLISTFFSAGPSGSFSVLKGTYQIK